MHTAMCCSALLESRGLPSHFFGSLRPRVHHLLHRNPNSGSGMF